MPRMNNIARSLAIGAVIGTATYAMTSARNKRNNNLKKKATRAARTVGTVINDITSMMG